MPNYEDNYTDRRRRPAGGDRSDSARRTRSSDQYEEMEQYPVAVSRRRQTSIQGSGNKRSRNTTASRRSSRQTSLRQEKRLVLKDIIVTSALLASVFIGMSGYMVWYAQTHQQELFQNDYNKREEDLLAKNLRGRILASDGQILAESTDNGDGTATRSYPFKNLFSHIVGYLPHGGSGVELLSDYDLVNTSISLNEKADFDAKEEKYPGDDVVTTLSVALQQAASDTIGNRRGAILVTEADTGKILCDVSKPDFDPDTIEEDWGTFDPDSGTLLNRATQGLYAPGSTFKIFDAIEFMQEDMSKAMAYTFDCPGYTIIDGESVNCYHWEVHGHVDLKESFAESCNSSFVTIGTSLNRDSYNASLKNMMFDESLPFDMPSGQSTYSLDASTSTKEVMQLAIGQGQTLMTPLHLNMVSAAVINNGMVHKPYVVDHIQTATGTVTNTTQPEEYRQIMTQEVSAKMQEMMRAVVTEGTASRLSKRPYIAGGKTGTAETGTDKAQSNAWFTGYAYDDNHKAVAITVLIENVGGSGGTSAVPAARDVLDAYFGYTPAPGEDDDANYINWGGTSNTTTTTTQETPQNSVALNMDTNGDGIMDAVDIDGDGIPDSFDTNGDGILDSNIGGGAISTGQEAPAEETAPAETGNQAGEAAAVTDPARFNLDTNWDGVGDMVDSNNDGLADDGVTWGQLLWSTGGAQDPAVNGGQTQQADQTQAANTGGDAGQSDAAQAAADAALQNIEQQNQIDQSEFNLDTNGDGIPDAVDVNGDGLPD